MAIGLQAPYVPDDLTSVKDCVSLLADTGHARCEKTVSRWIKKHGLPVWRRAGIVHVSFSDILRVHAAEVRRTLAQRPA